jgi:hypothetical protein
VPTTWEELVASVTARHPVHEGKMFGMPCLKRENGKVVAGHWKDGVLVPASQSDDWERLVEQAIG